MTGMWRHLGSSVSALVDGQLDEATAERAWEHVVVCEECRALVERERWIKRRLASMSTATERTGTEPPAELLGSLLHLDHLGEPDEWWRPHEAEERRRSRRRAGMAVVGAGSVSAALLGLTVISGAPISFGPDRAPASVGRSTSTPTPTTAVVAPRTTVRGRIPDWRLGTGEKANRATPVANRR